VTEQEWLACTDPKPMLEFLEGKASRRKVRLFAVACCRRIWPHLKDERSRGLVQVFEQFADGEATLSRIRAARERAAVAQEAIHWRGGDAVDQSAAEAVLGLGNVVQIEQVLAGACETAGEFVAHVALETGFHGRRWSTQQELHDNAFSVGESSEVAAQAALLRCIFSNPFRHVTVEPEWLFPNVTTFAHTIYDERAFDQMPELTVALEAAGCTNDDVLGHCRGPGKHARGCWVVDLLLGKE
jgi:hypothetical protein